MPHKISIIDKDGNQSEVTLPDFAMDATQERLIKSVQALGKMNPKTAKAYEDLIKETKNAVTATEDASDQQKKDAKALQNTVQNVGDKQVSALRQFRMNFADRVGKDMRDTFVSGGNILTAAIKTATVGLAAGAGLLYKTFMDTSEAFRSLAQSGLGGAGPSGTEAQDAVASLTMLGMSASEAASMLTSFGRASATLGKANFSKFVSGIAGAGTFAADLGLTLEEAAEFAADEVDMRQRTMTARMQLDQFDQASIKESIKLTQQMSTVIGRSMKDINESKKDFVNNNAQLAALMLSLPPEAQKRLQGQIDVMLKAAGALGGPFEGVMKNLLNAASSAIPMQDATMNQIAGLGDAGTQFISLVNQMGDQLKAGNLKDAQKFTVEITRMLARGGKENAKLLSILAADGTPMAEQLLLAAQQAALSGDKLIEALNAVTIELDPMVTAGANFQNSLSKVSGALVTARNTILGSIAEPFTNFVTALTETRLNIDKSTDSQIQKIREDQSLSDKEKEQRIKELNNKRDAYKRDLDGKAKAIKEDKNLSEKEKKQKLEELFAQERSATVITALQTALKDVTDTFIKVFFGTDGLNTGAEEFGETLSSKLIPWIKETAENLKSWLTSLEGNTFGEKLKSAAIGMIKLGISMLWETIKATAYAVLTSPAGWATLITLMGVSLLKSLALSTLTTLLTRSMTTTSTTASSAIKSAGNTLALAIRQVAMAVRRAGAGLGVSGGLGGGGGAGGGSRGGRGLRLNRLAGKASLAGVATGIVGGLASDALYDAGHEKSAAAVDTVANVAGMAGTGAMIGSIIPGVGTAIGAGIGAAAGLGMSLYQNWDTWFGSDDAQKAISEAGTEAIEGIDATGMAAMAMDPMHIRNVGLALETLNGVSVNNIAAGLTSLNPKLEQLLTSMQNVKLVFVDAVNKRLQQLLSILTGLNTQGEKLPSTTERLDLLAKQIIAMPITGIKDLATAFSALTIALRDFGNLTTDTRFSRMWDAFTGKEDTTEDVIKVLNNFASKVDSDKLLKAAQAMQAYNAAMGGYAQPIEVQRTGITQGTPAAEAAKKSSTVTPQMTNPNENMELTLGRIEILMKSLSDYMRVVKDNTDPAKRS